MKKQQRKKAGSTGQGASKKAGIIAVCVAVAIALIILTVLLFGPMLAARPVFADALKAPKTSDGTVFLCDPYVEGDPLPETREVTLSGAEGEALVTLFLDAFESFSYVEIASLSGTGWLPYLSVRGGTTVYFYLESDSVWVEKNSTFYRFRPANEAGRAAYAELYLAVTEYLSAPASEE